MNARWLRVPLLGALALTGMMFTTPQVAQAAPAGEGGQRYYDQDRVATRIVYRNGHRVRVRVIYERPHHRRYQHRYYWSDRYHRRHYYWR